MEVQPSLLLTVGPNKFFVVVNNEEKFKQYHYNGNALIHINIKNAVATWPQCTELDFHWTPIIFPFVHIARVQVGLGGESHEQIRPQFTKQCLGKTKY